MCQQTKQMTFCEIGVGLWSTAHFVYNSGGSRGGAPVLFLDQTEARRAENILWRPPPLLSQGLDHRAPPPPPPPFPLSEGLDRTIRHCIIYSHYSPVPPKPFLAFSCLFFSYSISSLKIFDYLCASSADETEYKLSDNLV